MPDPSAVPADHERLRSGARGGRRWFSLAVLALWIAFLCAVPDPRPLGAPEWLVSAVRSLTGAGEPGIRAAVTLVLRAGGYALLGLSTAFAVGAVRWDRRSVAALVLAPVLAVGTAWVNYGYFPIALQVQVAAISAVLGALLGMALRRNVAAAGALALAAAGLFAWGTATGIGDDLDAATRAAGHHVFAAAAEVPDGDAGFARLLEIAFAADVSRGADPVLSNRAAILALAVILGEEQVAGIAGRHLDRDRLPEAEALRARVTLYGRKDWPRHFWVSAGLTLLADGERSIAVGLTKELMDAVPGGTGFSFADLAADAAGNRFALAATRDADAARAMQLRIGAGVRVADFCPDLRDLPEGIARDSFHSDYGGLGGERTQRLVEQIKQRLAECGGLQ